MPYIKGEMIGAPMSTGPILRRYVKPRVQDGHLDVEITHTRELRVYVPPVKKQSAYPKCHCPGCGADIFKMGEVFSTKVAKLHCIDCVEGMLGRPLVLSDFTSSALNFDTFPGFKRSARLKRRMNEVRFN